MAKPAASQESIQAERNRENIELAYNAANNDASARKKVNELITPIIQYQTDRFCKRFCKENRYRFSCTLNSPIGSPPADAALCEWGNGSYAWMLDDLSSANRLKKYQARNNASLFDYCYVIANSLPFYERWKNWRFGRNIHVPDYIQALGPGAKTVFYGMRSQLPIEQISQQTSRSIDGTRAMSREIIKLLTQKNRLYLLSPPKNISLTHDDQDGAVQCAIEGETASYDQDIESIEDHQLLAKAWKQLNPVEQYVVEALVIEDQDAELVLNSLKKLNISFKNNVPAAELDRQQLYYFRRKTLSRLHSLMIAE
ncbi:MAG: hypothetical protein KJO03_02020 [Gammaproteobacteria bacterium]|nr:hypothetical protein [Gammaproteobacteria bacterium]